MSVHVSGNFVSIDHRLEIPFFPPDLFAEERATIYQLVKEVIRSKSYVLGESVARLEQITCAHTGAKHAIACASGTGGLNLAVQALGIGDGDEVIVPAFCCQPVASSVANRGATPIFADIYPELLTMDPADAEARISPRTKAIMPAHVFSIMADMPAYNALGAKLGLPIIEDSCVAQGAVLDGVAAGRWGRIGIFSHFQVKSLGTIGEGATIVTNDDELALRCRTLRDLGRLPHGDPHLHHEIGQDNRMDEIVAAFLIHRFTRFEERLERRAQIAQYYTERFAPLREQGLVAPPAGRNGRCYYVYALLAERRDALRAHLDSRGIGTHIYYPLPLPGQPAFAAYADLQHPYPNAVQAGQRNLALPIYPHLSDEQVEHIAESVTSFYQ